LCHLLLLLSGKGGTLYGAWYKGPFTLNVFNTAQRTPGNPLANDPAARARFYDAALTVVQEEEAKLEGGGAAGGGKVGECVRRKWIEAGRGALLCDAAARCMLARLCRRRQLSRRVVVLLAAILVSGRQCAWLMVRLQRL
jgi:hypothetical protein